MSALDILWVSSYFPCLMGTKKSMSNAQNTHSYHMFNDRIRGLLYHRDYGFIF